MTANIGIKIKYVHILCYMDIGSWFAFVKTKTLKQTNFTYDIFCMNCAQSGRLILIRCRKGPSFGRSKGHVQLNFAGINSWFKLLRNICRIYTSVPWHEKCTRCNQKLYCQFSIKLCQYWLQKILFAYSSILLCFALWHSEARSIIFLRIVCTNLST
jgi:hypothetical protein